MDEKAIWNYLIGKTGNAYGTAAIMGNLMAESSMNPELTTGRYASTSYTKDADNGKIDFAHDGVAFGLAQWCYHSRKQGLLDYARKKNASVGDGMIQLQYLWEELQGYKTALTAVKYATDIREASDVFMLKYEKPSNTGESAKKKRADYGQKYYDRYANAKTVSAGTKSVRAKVNVNVRVGDSQAYAKVGVLQKGKALEWVATAENGWHAVRYLGKEVCWVSGEFTEIVG